MIKYTKYTWVFKNVDKKNKLNVHFLKILPLYLNLFLFDLLNKFLADELLKWKRSCPNLGPFFLSLSFKCDSNSDSNPTVVHVFVKSVSR